MSDDDRDRRGRDVADRLARRFESAGGDIGNDDDDVGGDGDGAGGDDSVDEENRHSQPSERGDRSKPSQRSKQSDRSEPSQRSESSGPAEKSKDSVSSEKLAKQPDSPEHPDATQETSPVGESDPETRSQQSTQQRSTTGSQRADESGAESDRSKPSQTSEQSTGVHGAENVKEAWESTYIYLPDVEPTRIHSRLHNEFDRLTYECSRDLGWKPKKNRHYYPVVTLDGVETIEEMDGEGFYERVAELGLVG